MMITHKHPLGAISTSHALATEAGAAAIEAGGNAIDAALAAAATLCVVYPNNVALGGDLVALVKSPDGAVHFLNGTGRAPALQTLSALQKKHGESLPLRGIDTVTMPGGVCGWNSLHVFGAKLAWSDHFEAAIAHASNGVPTARSVAASIINEQDSLEADPGCRAVFIPSGLPLGEGDQLVQPALANTLSRLAAYGSAEFYEGEVGHAWIAGLQRLGSRISLDDAIAFNAQWEKPIEGYFAGHRIVTSPPNTSGFAMLRALEAITAGIDDPLGAGAGELSAAFRSANAIRAAFLADPEFGGVSGAELISMSGPEHPQSFGAAATGDTVGLSAVSADGWAVSLINSVYHGFGACVLEPETGILFQNRGTSFALDANSPNVFEAGKRPRHTLMPMLVFRDEELVMVPATMGGSAQPQIHTQLLLRALAGSSPKEVTHAPRWIVSEPNENGEVIVIAEEDVSEEAQQAITAANFPITVLPPHSEKLGHSNLIRIDPEGYSAASDPRSEGLAIVIPAS